MMKKSAIVSTCIILTWLGVVPRNLLRLNQWTYITHTRRERLEVRRREEKKGKGKKKKKKKEQTKPRNKVSFTLLSAPAGVSTLSHPQTSISCSLVSEAFLPATSCFLAYQVYHRSFLFNFQMVGSQTSQSPESHELLPRQSFSRGLEVLRPDKHRECILKS